MPAFARESEILKRIADEFGKLGDALRDYPPGDGGTRSAASASAILSSLQKINATIAVGARARHLGPTGFSVLGREFSKIGATLSSLGSPTKSTARKTAKRTSSRTATKRTATKRTAAKRKRTR